MKNLIGKVVLITGAGRGIGRTLAEAFAAQGAVVAVNDLNPRNLEGTVNRIVANEGRVKDYAFDIARRLPIMALVQQVLDDWGRIDILINAEAVEPHHAILDMDEWDFHRTLDVNLAGPFFLMQQVGRAMKAQGRGVIVNVGRLENAKGELRNRSAFLASQSGLAALSRSAAQELAPHGINVQLFEVGCPPDDEGVRQILVRCAVLVEPQ